MTMTDQTAAPMRSRATRSRYRRFSPRRLLVLLAFSAATVGLAGYVTAGVVGLRLLEIPTGCGVREFAHQTPADFVASNASRSLTVDTTAYRFTDYRDVALPARGTALTIRGWYAPGPRGTASPTVILANGIYSCRRDPVTLLPAAMLHRAGFGVLVVDLRNHGDSDVDDGHSALGGKEYADLLGAWDWLVKRGHDPRRIGLFGTSLSGASSLIATGEEPAIAAAWVDSSFADTEALLGERAVSFGVPDWPGIPDLLGGAVIPVGRLLGGVDIGARSPDRALANLAGRPLAIVQGLDDKQVLPHHAADLAGAAGRAGTTVEPWLVAGAGHQEAVLLRPADYEVRLVAFFTAALGCD
jgi:dipeptidyl aminopeptidase/acylaminoacyl peptidase